MFFFSRFVTFHELFQVHGIPQCQWNWFTIIISGVTGCMQGYKSCSMKLDSTQIMVLLSSRPTWHNILHILAMNWMNITLGNIIGPTEAFKKFSPLLTYKWAMLWRYCNLCVLLCCRKPCVHSRLTCAFFLLCMFYFICIFKALARGGQITSGFSAQQDVHIPLMEIDNIFGISNMKGNSDLAEPNSTVQHKTLMFR